MGAFGGFRRLQHCGRWQIRLFFSVRCHGQSPGTAKCRIQDIGPSDAAEKQVSSARPSKQIPPTNPQNSVDFLQIIPYHVTR
jgi:hypothetical protein